MAEADQGSPYRACTLIMSGGWVSRGKSVKARRLMAVDQALAELRDGKPAYVAPGRLWIGLLVAAVGLLVLRW